MSAYTVSPLTSSARKAMGLTHGVYSPSPDSARAIALCFNEADAHAVADALNGNGTTTWGKGVLADDSHSHVSR